VTVDLLGYAAAALVLLAFSLRSLIALRVVAIASNVTFIAYASAAHVWPVLVLHAALLPINGWRLRQCWIARTRTERLRARFAANAGTRPARPLESYVRLTHRIQDAQADRSEWCERSSPIKRRPS